MLEYRQLIWEYLDDTMLMWLHPPETERTAEGWCGDFHPIEVWPRLGTKLVEKLANKDLKSALAEARAKNTPYEMSLALGKLALGYGTALAEIHEVEQLISTHPPSKSCDW